MAKSKDEKLSPAQEARLLETISELVLKGYSVRQISAKIKSLKPTAVHNRIKALEKEWLKEADKNFALHRGRLLARLQMIQTNAWKMFIKSCKNFKEDSETKNYGVPKDRKKDPDGIVPFSTDEADDLRLSSTSEHVKTNVVHGNPKYLSIIVDCIEKEAKLLGVYDWVSLNTLEEGLQGSMEIRVNREIYIPGKGVLNPNLISPAAWDELYNNLEHQDAHHYSGND